MLNQPNLVPIVFYTHTTEVLLNSLNTISYIVKFLWLFCVYAVINQIIKTIIFTYTGSQNDFYGFYSGVGCYHVTM